MGTRTSGSQGGGEKTTARKRGTAPRRRPNIDTVKRTSRNVKHWQNGDICLRWTAAGMLETEQQFRKIIGYKHLAKLVIAVERHAILAAPNNPTRQENREPVTV